MSSLAVFPGTFVQSAFPPPPVAAIRPVEPQEKCQDSYDWLREPAYPGVSRDEIPPHLAAENTYVETVLGHEDSGLRARLFAELKARVKQDDGSVPWRQGNYFYRARYLEGRDRPVWLRKHLDEPESAEKLILDPQAEATGKSFHEVATDSASLFHVLKDGNQRPKRVMHHVLGQDPASDRRVHEEAASSWWVLIPAFRPAGRPCRTAAWPVPLNWAFLPRAHGLEGRSTP